VTFVEMLATGFFSLASAVLLIEMVIAYARHRQNRSAASAYRRYHSRNGVDD
jgi:hypothetical protein